MCLNAICLFSMISIAYVTEISEHEVLVDTRVCKMYDRAIHSLILQQDMGNTG